MKDDFTKEELEYINDYIFKGAAGIRMDSHNKLRSKIQLMIDNYCEHEVAIHFVSGVGTKLVCQKCGWKIE